jgi:hypothetical protein
MQYQDREVFKFENCARFGSTRTVLAGLVHSPDAFPSSEHNARQPAADQADGCGIERMASSKSSVLTLLLSSI